MSIWVESDLGADYKPGVFSLALHWGVIWPRVIALAWENATFAQQLLDDPRKALKDYFAYNLNPELDLTIEWAAQGTYKNPYPPDGPPQDLKVDPWAGLPKMQLKLFLPPAPANQHEWAIAIADYADTGRNYPFTSL
jgi:ribosomally synthesized peptide (two-chain TOMM family)